MAFGFPPKYIEDSPLGEFTTAQYIVFANEATIKLGWKVSVITDTGLIAFTGFSVVSWSEEVTITVENGIARLRSECNGSQLMDWGKNKNNIKHLIYEIYQQKKALSPEEISLKAAELKLSQLAGDGEDLRQAKAPLQVRHTKFFSIFIPTEGYCITPIIINLNIAIFILMTLSGVHMMTPDNQSLVNWGANFRPSTMTGQWWRLFTSIFVHIGIIHLLMNMYALVYIGTLLEHQLGKTRFAAAYLLSGICASVASLWWHDITISAGASGAIFGIYGVFLAMLTTDLIEKSARRALLTSIAVFVGYNLLNGMKAGIDNAAHLGGLVSGLTIGYAYVSSLREPEDRELKLKTVVILTLAVVSFAFLVGRSLPNDFKIYESKMAEFVTYESNAISATESLEDMPKEQRLAEIKGSGIYFWNECLKIVKTVSTLKLPEDYLQRNNRIMEYCNLRIKRCELLCKSIEEGSDKYENEINKYDKQIETIITELTGKKTTKD